MSDTPLINRKAVRSLALEAVEDLRPTWGASLVSAAFLARINLAVRLAVRREVREAPSVGKTLK